MQTDNFIRARRPDQVVIKERTCSLLDFAIPVDHRMKIKESEKIDEYFELTRK